MFYEPIHDFLHIKSKQFFVLNCFSIIDLKNWRRWKSFLIYFVCFSSETLISICYWFSEPFSTLPNSTPKSIKYHFTKFSIFSKISKPWNITSIFHTTYLPFFPMLVLFTDLCQQNGAVIISFLYAINYHYQL